MKPTTGGLGLGLILLLGACATDPAPPHNRPDVTAAAPQPAASQAERRTERVESWLDQADRALSDDRLLTPLGDNAHDRYRAVLLLEPDNARARSGLQAIVLRYIELARSAAARGAFSQALEYLERADSVDQGNPLVAEFADDLRAERERLRSAEPLAQEGKTVRLNQALLSGRSDQLVAELQGLAQRVRETGEFVLIVTRTDAEGRWVYQQMREAVTGYLLRGDIQLGSPPRIELQPPL